MEMVGGNSIPHTSHVTYWWECEKGLLWNQSESFLNKCAFTMWFANSVCRYLPTLNEKIYSHKCKNAFYIFFLQVWKTEMKNMQQRWYLAHKTKNVYYLELYIKSLPISAQESTPQSGLVDYAVSGYLTL